jgi:ferredoxin
MSLAIVLNVRRPENAPGPYFVDDSCISCGACWRHAPELLVSHPVHTFAYFERQPENSAEEASAASALALCPVGAIKRE